MDRSITGYHEDAEGDWVAELTCGHNQHVRHRPPFQDRPWVVSAAGRQARLGTALSCPLCDRAELPEAVRLVRSSPEWDELTLPPGLRRAHRLAAGTWGRIFVQEGRLRLSMALDPAISVELGPSSPPQAIPPEAEHEVEPVGPVRFSIEFFTVEPPPATAGRPEEHLLDEGEIGGDPACWAGLLCPECGAVLTVDPHRLECSIPEP